MNSTIEPTKKNTTYSNANANATVTQMHPYRGRIDFESERVEFFFHRALTYSVYI